MIKWRTEKVRPTYVPTFCVGLDGMCRVLLGRCCRLIEDAVSTIYRAFIFRSAVAPPPPARLGLTVVAAGPRFLKFCNHFVNHPACHVFQVGPRFLDCLYFY